MSVRPAMTTESPAREAAQATIAAAVAGLERLGASLDESFDRVAERLVALHGKVVTLGVGKSGHAAAKVAATFRSVGLPALTLPVNDVMHGDLGVVRAGDVVILFSKSGTTRELLEIAPHLRGRGATIVAIVGSPRSPLWLAADLAIDASIEREGCPLDAAPMASVLVAQAVGDALAAAVTSGRGLRTEDFARLHPAGALGVRLTLTVADVMRRGDELALLPEDASLKDAVIEITRAGYGAVCVVDAGGRLAGFVTDGDIRRSLLATDDLGGVAVASVMTRSPLAVGPELLLSEALLMLEQGPKPMLTAPVVDAERRCVGLLRLHDAVRAHLPA